MNQHLRILVPAILSIVLLSACSTGKIHREESEMKQIFSQICAPGMDTQEAKGSAWLKVSTSEESGQFPAQFHVIAPSTLKIEATNLVGAVEAFIRIQDDHYSVKWTGKESVEEEGTGSWRGIPLEWAVNLFLGRVPCPQSKELLFSSEDTGELTVQARYTSGRDNEKFTYAFKNWGGKSWAERLKWKKEGSEVEEIEMSFEDPDDVTASPAKVLVQSSLGEVKIRWKERRRVR